MRIWLIIFTLFLFPLKASADGTTPVSDPLDTSAYTIFDDKLYLEGYSKKYLDLSQEILLEMIKDDTLASFRAAAAVRVFKEKYASELVAREKKIAEKILLRRLSRDDSAFVKVEILHTLCLMDRYRYFKTMVPALIQKLDHYNQTVNEIAFKALDEVVLLSKNNRPREAWIVFTTLRKILFLSRKRLAEVKEVSIPLAQKLKLLRWSVKIIGTQELKKLPKEVIPLL